jgi:2-polyprenyl-3-methyl-5-hydroxy-6-metoxy-1,4-benzoquinol methylase
MVRLVGQQVRQDVRDHQRDGRHSFIYSWLLFCVSSRALTRSHLPQTFEHITKRFSADTWKDADVLDYGCGTGTMAMHLAPQVRSITGVDVSEGMLKRMRAKVEESGVNNVTCHALTLEGEGSTVKEVVPAGQKFDLIYTCYVLHHVANVASTLRSMLEVLKPGGRLIVCEFPPGEDTHLEASLPQLQGYVLRWSLCCAFLVCGLAGLPSHTPPYAFVVELLIRIPACSSLLYIPLLSVSISVSVSVSAWQKCGTIRRLHPGQPSSAVRGARSHRRSGGGRI